MKFEECSRRILLTLADLVDPNRRGSFIEIGIGTFDFWFTEFAELGFRSLAVEPLPSEHLMETCRAHNVSLEVSSITDEDGCATMYLGQFNGQPNTNLSSLEPDWWGSSSKTREVPSLKLDSLLEKWTLERVTAMKLDVEGSEWSVLSGLRFVPESALPMLVQFEYGGGGSKVSQVGGWAPKYFRRTCAALQLLKALEYEWLLLIDRDLPSARMFRLSDLSVLEEAFHPQSHVGNAIVCKGSLQLLKADIVKLCKPYACFPQGFRTSLQRLGSEASVHSFKWILPHVIAQQYEIKGRPLRVLEYGPGCNSEQFLKSLVCQHLVSVEDNPEWYAEFAPVISSDPSVEVDYRLVEVESEQGRAYHGGHCWTEEEILDYARYPLKYGDGYFDIIFVDSADRQDEVMVGVQRYPGWPIRNLCLELAHSLLHEAGVVVLHDVPGPFARMNLALAQSVQGFRYCAQFGEFYTTVLSDSLPLATLTAQIERSYRLGPHTRLLSRLLNDRNVNWYENRLLGSVLRKAMRLHDPSSPGP